MRCKVTTKLLNYQEKLQKSSQICELFFVKAFFFDFGAIIFPLHWKNFLTALAEKSWKFAVVVDEDELRSLVEGDGDEYSENH